MHTVHRVRAPVAERAVAEVVPAAPLALHVVLRVFVVRRGAEPRVPVDPLRHLLAGRERGDLAVPLVPTARVVHVRREVLQLRDVDDARLDVVLELPVVRPAVPLVAHLRGDAVLRGGLHQQLALLERVGERLFGEHGEPALHRGHQRGEVGEIGRHDGDRVDLALHRVQHLPEVGEARHVGIAFQRRNALLALEIRVAQRGDLDELRVGEALDVAPRLLADAHAREAHLVAGLERAASREARIRACRKRRLDERSSVYFHGHASSFFDVSFKFLLSTCRAPGFFLLWWNVAPWPVRTGTPRWYLIASARITKISAMPEMLRT